MFTQQRFTRSLPRRKERQLWVMLLTISMTANTFLILFLHSFWAPALIPEHLPVPNSQNQIVQLEQNGPRDRMSPHPPPKLVRMEGKQSVQGATKVAYDHDDASHIEHPHLPKPVETVGEEFQQGTPKAAKKIAWGDKESSRLGGLVPGVFKQTISTNNDSDLPYPWLRPKPDNMTRLEQAIRSLQVLTDDESTWKGTSFFQPRSRVVTSITPGVLINSVHCPSKGPYVLLLIPSVDANVQARHAIRSTWASPTYGTAWPNDNRNFTSLVQVAFFLGFKAGSNSPALEEESSRFQDIVQLDFQESYQNLSLKMGLAVEWSARYCPGAVHVMKVDEDTFVDLSFLLDFLYRLSGLGFPHFVVGFHHNKERPRVLRAGKWGVSKDLYPFPYLPRYVYGHSYVISSEAVKKLGAVWRYMPLLPNEDALLTGVLTKVAGVTRIHCDWFAMEYDRRFPAIPREELANGRSISQTNFKPVRKLFDMWQMVQKAYRERFITG